MPLRMPLLRSTWALIQLNLIPRQEQELFNGQREIDVPLLLRESIHSGRVTLASSLPSANPAPPSWAASGGDVQAMIYPEHPQLHLAL